MSLTSTDPQHYRVQGAYECLRQSGAAGLWLDVGCGPGSGLADEFPRAKVVGLDNSLAVLHEARRRRPDRVLVMGSLDALPFRRHCFDLIALIAVLGALPHGAEVETFEQLAFISGPGATLVILVSAKGWLWEAVGHRWLYPPTWRHYSRGELLEWLEGAGYDVEEVGVRGGYRSLLSDLVASRWPNRVVRRARYLPGGWSSVAVLMNRWQSKEFVRPRVSGRYLYVRARKRD